VGDYLQSFSDSFNLGPSIKLNARVEELKKSGKKWHLHSSTLLLSGPNAGTKFQELDVNQPFLATSSLLMETRNLTPLW
jgi:hypothetical protein